MLRAQTYFVTRSDINLTAIKFNRAENITLFKRLILENHVGGMSVMTSISRSSYQSVTVAPLIRLLAIRLSVRICNALVMALMLTRSDTGTQLGY